MKYRQYLAGGGPIVPDKPKMTPDEERRMAMEFARRNPGYKGPYGTVREQPLEESNVFFDAMLAAPGLRGLASLVKRPPSSWKNIPEGPDKESMREVGQILFGTRL
jgi:hypothetical protein